MPSVMKDMHTNPSTGCSTVHTSTAYTLVELLVSLALSLLLLLGVAELFKRVGGTLNETQSAINVSARLADTSMLLRQDLERIPVSLAKKPSEIYAFINETTLKLPEDYDGYLTIIEGPDSEFYPRYLDEFSQYDRTASDVDDIIAFTANALPAVPFRGMIGGRIAERHSAEIVWFVRGNTLYRRQRLIDDETVNENVVRISPPGTEGDFPNKSTLNLVEPQSGQFAIVLADETIDGGRQRYDAVATGHDDFGERIYAWRDLLTQADLARRARRFGHDGLGANNQHQNPFPHPLYAVPHTGWYYLRMPTFEETDFWGTHNIRFWKTATNLPETPQVPQPDLWVQPHFFPDWQDRQNGTIRDCVTTPRNHRAGEDVVLTNVLSFDVRMWCPDANEFIDLGSGEEGTAWVSNDRAAAMHGYTRLDGRRGYVWDSWTQHYKENDGITQIPPPYTAPLKAIRITIRCFDPESQMIRQTTVVHRFDNPN